MTGRLLTVADVAEITRLSEYTIRQAVRDLELPAIKIRGRVRIDEHALAAWLDEARVTTRAGNMAVRAAPVVSVPRRPMPPGGSAREAIRARRSAA